MSNEILTPEQSPPALAPYSPGTKAGGFIFISGTLAMSPTGETVGVGDVRAQTRCVLDTVRRVMEEGGGSLRNVVMNQIFLKDLADYAAMNEVYREYFPENPPARYCIQTPLVRPDFLVEIATTAYVGN